MKRQIRRNVFETNSSSMHSLVVKKESEHYNEVELRESVWLYDDGEWHIHSTEPRPMQGSSGSAALLPKWFP